MSQVNRHHPRRGTVRPRPPEGANPLALAQVNTQGNTPQTPEPLTSDRPTKKAKTTGDNPATLPTRHIHVPPPDPTTTAGGPSPHTMPLPTQTPAHPVQALMEALVSQLETLAKTVSSLVAHHPDLASVDLSRAKQAIDTIASTLHEPATTQPNPHTAVNRPTMPPQPKSYAAATATTDKHHVPNRVEPGKPHPSRPSHPHPAVTKRLVVDFHRSQIKRKPHVMTIRDTVTELFAQSGFKVFAAKYTKGNNVVLSMSPSAKSGHAM